MVQCIPTARSDSNGAFIPSVGRAPAGKRKKEEHISQMDKTEINRNPYFSEVLSISLLIIKNYYPFFLASACRRPTNRSYEQALRLESYEQRVVTSPIRLPACNGEYLIPLVIIVSMCEVFSLERRCTRHALQKHYTNRQIFKKF